MKNLVFIMCDQLRKDFLGCYGNPYVRTPNIDSIASDGVRFNRCTVTNPICQPSRMSIFTGRYPHSTGIWTNGLMPPCQMPTIADELKKHGYHTYSIGKLHFEPTDCGADAPLCSREDHRHWKAVGDNVDFYGPYWGFDYVEFTCGHATKPLAHYGKWFHQHGGSDEMSIAKKLPPFESCAVTTMPERLHDSIFVGEKSAEIIRGCAKRNENFFLVTSFPDPHHPFNPPYETALRYKDTPVKLPVSEDDSLDTRPEHYRLHKQGLWHRAGVLTADPDDEKAVAELERTREMIADFMDSEIRNGLALTPQKDKNNYAPEDVRDQRIRATYAMVDLIDQGVGKVLDALRETGTLDDTVIVFTADHGELMGDHGLWKKGPFFFDGLINVPLIFRDPSRPAGSSDALASSVDIYPTLCELLGLPIPRTCEGVSLAEAFEGKEVRDFCLFEYRNGYFDRDVNTLGYLDRHYKFVQYQNGELEMTDRINDPDENVNIAYGNANAALVGEYRAKLLQAILETGSRYPEQICHA